MKSISEDKIIDISIPINERLPVWEDKFKPEKKRYSKIEEGEVSNTSFIKMDMHTGTHIDFPYHFLQNGKKSDEYPIKHFIMNTVVIEIKEKIINEKEIKNSLLSNINYEVEAILFKTPNSFLYKRDKFSKNYTYLSVSGAEFIIKNKIKLVGIDYLSIEDYQEKNFPVHKILFRNNILILEGINLLNVKEGLYKLFAMPLKINDVEALPVRAFLIKGGESCIKF